MCTLSDRAKALLEQLFRWEETGESIPENLWTQIEKEGTNSATLKLVNELEAKGFLGVLWADNKLYSVILADRCRG